MKGSTKAIIAAIIAVIIIVSAFAYVTYLQPKSLTKLTLGVPVQGFVGSQFALDILGGSNVPVDNLGQPKWSDYGLDVTLQFASGSGQLMQFASTGQIQIGFASGFPTVTGIANGAPIKIVGLIDPVDSDSRVVAPLNGKVKTAADLKNGVTVAVTSPNGQSDLYAKNFAATHGLTIGKDIIIKYLGNGWTDAVTSGSVDAAIGFDPTADQLVVQGKAMSVASGSNFTSNFGTILYNVFWANNNMIQSQPDVVRNVLRAYQASLKWAVSHENQTIKIESDRWQADSGLVKTSYENAVPNFVLSLAVNPQMAQNTENILLQNGVIKSNVSASSMISTEFTPLS